MGLAVGLTLGFVLLEVIFGVFAHSLALLSDAGLPHRPWYRHTIFAPGELTGYAAGVFPGVNEAIDAQDANLAAEQLQVLTQALNRAAGVLETVH